MNFRKVGVGFTQYCNLRNCGEKVGMPTPSQAQSSSVSDQAALDGKVTDYIRNAVMLIETAPRVSHHSRNGLAMEVKSWG